MVTLAYTHKLVLFTYFLLFPSFCINVELVLFFRRKIVAHLLNAKEQNDRKARIRVQNLLVCSVILTFLYNVKFGNEERNRHLFYFLSDPPKLSSQVKKQNSRSCTESLWQCTSLNVWS